MRSDERPREREQRWSAGAIVARAGVQCCRVTAVGMVANASHPTERGGDGQGGSAPGKPDGDLILVKTVKLTRPTPFSDDQIRLARATSKTSKSFLIPATGQPGPSRGTAPLTEPSEPAYGA